VGLNNILFKKNNFVASRYTGLWTWTDSLDLREIGWGVLDWIDLAQDRDQWRALVNTILNLWVS
jgi:hypothetical protein